MAQQDRLPSDEVEHDRDDREVPDEPRGGDEDEFDDPEFEDEDVDEGDAGDEDIRAGGFRSTP